MKRVVLTPELVARGLRDAACLRVLNEWRDGKLVPVINRDLILHYTKALRSAGIGHVQLKRWLWWFTAAERSEYRPQIEISHDDVIALCDRLAFETNVECVVHSDVFKLPDFTLGSAWESASELLQ